MSARKLSLFFDRNSIEDQEARAALGAKILILHGIRVGNLESAREAGTFGLITLRPEHYRDGYLNFPGKCGVWQRIKLSPKTAEQVEILIGRGSETIFDVTDYTIRKVIKDHVGDHTPKDLRKEKADEVALKESKRLQRGPKPSTKSELNEELARICEKVSSVLGNTKDVAKRSYIDPKILERHERKRGKHLK